MLHAAIEDVGTLDSARNCGDTGLQLGQHARRRRPGLDELLQIVDDDPSNQRVLVTQIAVEAFHISQVNHLEGPKRLGQRTGGSIGIEVVCLAVLAASQRSHYRYVTLVLQALYQPGVDRSDLADKPQLLVLGPSDEQVPVETVDPGCHRPMGVDETHDVRAGAIDYVLGITKAYTTRVGEGPFPTELFDKTGEELQIKGGEFGATTGRKRRCGWLDGVVANDAVRLNGLTGLAITKLDVLSGQPVIKMAESYRLGGKDLSSMPSNISQASAVEPVYTEIPGWEAEIDAVRSYADLPVEAQDYIKRIEDYTGVEAVLVSVGPDREQTLLLKNPFEK